VTLYIHLEEALAIHDAVAPGQTHIRDVGLIQSALNRPQVSAFGEDAYPSVWEKAAALMQSLACNHGWIDGNKRTAWTVTMTFLTINGHPLDPEFDQRRAEGFVVAVAQGLVVDLALIAAELETYAVR